MKKSTFYLAYFLWLDVCGEWPLIFFAYWFLDLCSFCWFSWPYLVHYRCIWGVVCNFFLSLFLIKFTLLVKTMVKKNSSGWPTLISPFRIRSCDPKILGLRLVCCIILLFCCILVFLELLSCHVSIVLGQDCIHIGAS